MHTHVLGMFKAPDPGGLASHLQYYFLSFSPELPSDLNIPESIVFLIMFLSV